MTINCKGKLIDLSCPKIMGILNLTPDSFYDGGKYKSEKEILNQVELMLHDGATFIDIGAYSSRPNADHISEQTELDRLLPVVKLLLKEFPEVLISVDTFRSSIAKESVIAGAAIINDISGGSLDNEMFSTVGKLQVPYVLMHMIGNPQNMQNKPEYKNITQDVSLYFAQKVAQLRAEKVNDIILDVGFGFGKTIEHNYQLLKQLQLFKTFELPILSGISRKSMLYKLLNTTPEEALNATTVANTISLLNGANLLRVHDVKEAQEAIRITQQII